ncbi:MAG: asparagine synthase (glutamine-hydrolyzing) [Candidatus Aenigmatarchaeota archaeon]
MCGILGVFSKDLSSGLILKSLEMIAHRGPDGHGIWQDKDTGICLGHRRLAILDLSEAGKQPMHFVNLVVTYNGEIYNFLEIRKELEKKGYRFYTQTDTEVLLASFQEWGEGCLRKFNGMWAFAIWDKQRKKLFLSRDRFGKKPLFYAFIDDKFVFASEMKAIFPFLPEVKPSRDFQWCKNNLFAYESTEKTLIEGIKRFPAASYAYLELDDIPKKELKCLRYWETIEHLTEVPERYEEQVEKFRELFFDACKIRMRSDVSIGTALSGGLDSSATICTMAYVAKNEFHDRVSADWQHAFIAAFPSTFLDESYYAQKVAEYLQIPATYIPIDPAKGIEKLEKYLYFFEELYLTSPIPMMDLYAAVKAGGITVTLDGHGADELFAGYGKDIFRAFLDAGVNLKAIKNVINTYKGLRNIDSVQIPKENIDFFTYWQYVKQAHNGELNVLKSYVKHILGFKTENIQEKRLGYFNSYLYEIFHKTILPTLLRNYDRYSMANGVEIRMPFMDHRLVSYCFSLSWKSKLRNGYTKAIVRDALKDIMPQEVVWRTTKIGFNTPIVDWMKNEWKEFLLDNLYSTDFENCNLIDKFETRKKVEKVINDEKATFSDGEQAWISLMPYLWEKSLVKSKLN